MAPSNDAHPDPSQFRVLIDEPTLRARCCELGAAISRDHAGKAVVFVCVLRGAFVFAADLVRAVTVPTRIEFVQASSYSDGSRSTGQVTLEQDISAQLEGRHVVLVEDIVDTGLTSQTLLSLLRSRGAASVRLAALLHKPARQVRSVSIDYLGFTIPDEFVVGYGLDLAQAYRNLPDLRIFPAALVPQP